MNRNRNYKKTIAAALCVALSAEAVVPAFAAGAIEDKDENVYVNLNQDGSVSGIYVVNEYTLGADTEIVDYGDYSAVKNLSTEDEILLEDGKVTVNAAKGKFLYQGDMADTTLPWLIDISYTLDGKENTAEELPGKSGALKISVSVKDNPASDDEFFDNYLMQATVTLDTEKCSNIRADGATEANVGKDRQILYNIMAGQEKEFTISADVTEFEMDALSFQAVPMSFDIDVDSLDTSSITEKTDEIKDAAEEFDDGAGELDDGAQELLDGVEELKDGADELKDGASDLNSGTGELVSGAGELSSGTGELVSGANELYSGAASLNSGLKSLNSGAKSLNKGIQSAASGAHAAQKGAKELAEGAKEAAEGSMELKDGSATLADSLKQLQTGAGSLQAALNMLTEKSPELTGGSSQIQAALLQIQKSLDGITVGTEQMQTLLDSSTAILTAIGQAADGAQAVSDGLAQIQESYGSIDELEAKNTEAAAFLSGVAGTAQTAYGAVSGNKLIMSMITSTTGTVSYTHLTLPTKA